MEVWLKGCGTSREIRTGYSNPPAHPIALAGLEATRLRGPSPLAVLATVEIVS